MPRSWSAGNISHLLDNNRKWIESVLSTDPDYFTRYKDVQTPQYFWIGCSDSRVVAEAALGLGAGDLFVHRNVGNCISHYDQNAMSALEYSVKVLKVKHVLVCGHENCGAVKAALTMPSSNPMLTNCWISQIRDVRNANVDDLAGLDLESQMSRLVQLNVCRQVFNVCTSPVIQQAWESGQEVYVHGLVFNVATGELCKAVGPIGGNDDVPEDSSDLSKLEASGSTLTEPHSHLGKLKPSRSLATVMGKLGEALQDLEDDPDESASDVFTHGTDASTMTAPTMCHTMPSSIATTPRHFDTPDGKHENAMGDACNTPRGGSAMLFDSVSDPPPQHTNTIQDSRIHSDVTGDSNDERLRNQQMQKPSPIASLATQNANCRATSTGAPPVEELAAPQNVPQFAQGLNDQSGVPRNSRQSGLGVSDPPQAHSEPGLLKSQASCTSLHPSSSTDGHADRMDRVADGSFESYSNLVARIGRRSSTTGDIPDLSRRLTQQLSFHKIFENAAKHL